MWAVYVIWVVHVIWAVYVIWTIYVRVIYNIEKISRSFKGDKNNALDWFNYNQLAVYADKFQVIFMGLEKG